VFKFELRSASDQQRISCRSSLVFRSRSSIDVDCGALHYVCRVELLKDAWSIRLMYLEVV